MFLTFMHNGLPILVIAIALIILVIFKFVKKKSALKIISSVVLVALIAANLVFLALPSLQYLASFKFTSEPVVLDGGDFYSVIWATNVPASAKLEIKDKDNNIYKFTDASDGVGSFSYEIHRVDVEKHYLEDEGNTYSVSSRKTLKNNNYGYKLGKEITSGSYDFKGVDADDENISFFTISDIQGGAKVASKVIDMARDEQYDFVLLLGDYSNWYNDVQKDIVVPLLQLAAKASRSEMPCLYMSGNHEIKGSISKEINRIFPTPSPTNERYYTYSYGQMYITALFFGDDHADVDPRYYGVSEFSAYKAKQYEWLKTEVMAKEEYKDFKYHIGFVHIPIINDENFLTKDQDCNECNSYHSEMMDEFKVALEEMNIQLLVSAHTHKSRLVSHPDVAFKNLQTGGVGEGIIKTKYNTSLVRVSPDKIEYTFYYNDGTKTTDSIPVLAA